MKNFIEAILVIFAVIFLVYSVLLGLGFHQDIILPTLNWKGSLIIGVALWMIYQFGFEDPIWRIAKK